MTSCARSMLEEMFSRYRILQKLGAGGMGEVYLAEDTTLNRRVALKLLPSQHTQSDERLRRFKQEARAASALNHPNILTIHEVGEVDGRHFIATEFVDGETLRARLDRAGTMKARDALNVAVQVASALSTAHEAGIVHRDIKPENVMIRRDGYVKVLDFGVAKLLEAAPAADADVATRTMAAQTAAGAVIGTVQYMSPEQANGTVVDSRSDIFSFGAVLYELLAGAPAFTGESLTQTIVAVVNQEPKPLPAHVGPEIAQIVARCLRKDPARRYQTMADLKVALEEARDRVARPPVRTGQWRRMTAIGAVVLIAAILVATQLWRPQQPNDPARAVAITTLQGLERFPSLSPEGDRVAFAWTGDAQDNQDIYVRLIGQDSQVRLTTDPKSDYNPVWSPDGKLIAFFRSQPPGTTGSRARELRVIPSLGGAERRIADIRSLDFAGSFSADAVYLAWSPDGKSLIVTDSPGEGQPDALFVVALDSGERRRLTNPTPPALADTSPSLSPDGRSLVFLRRTSWGGGELHLIQLTDKLTPAGEPRRLSDAGLRADYPAWMPNGKEIVFSAKRGLWRMNVAEPGTPQRLPYVGEDGMMPVISRQRDGRVRLVYVRNFVDTNFWRIDTTAPGAAAVILPVKVISSSREEFHCRFSPDGKRIAFVSRRQETPEVWTANPDGSAAMQLTSLGAPDTTWPSWSPDGQRIVFSSTLGGEFDIYVVDAGGGKPRRLTSHPAIDIQPAFSRDGKWIYFSSMRSGDFRIWKMPADGGDAVQVTPNQGRGAAESADGRALYYHAVSIAAPLWRLPLSGGEPVKIADEIAWYNFAVIEGGAYYMRRVGSDAQLQFLDFATGRSTTIAHGLGDVYPGLTASPDGRTILFTRIDASADDLMLVENFR